MKANIGSLDKVIRLVLAAILIFLYFRNSSGTWTDFVLIAVAAIALLTALVGTCPLYLLLGIRTSKKSPEQEKMKIVKS